MHYETMTLSVRHDSNISPDLLQVHYLIRRSDSSF